MTDTTDPMYTAVAGELADEELYPIREVSRLTGVNPVTLRAWERRYGLLVPHRTESGHRLYSLADIERVRKVTAWIDRGVAVSKVASIIDREVAVSQAPVVGREQQQSQASADFRQWHSQLVEAVNRSDLARLDSIYGQVHSTFPLPTVLRDIVMPVWKLFRDKAGPDGLSGEWSLLDAFLRGRLFQRIGYHRSGLSAIMLAALPGGATELELLVAAALIAEAGANITYVPVMSSYAQLRAMAEGSGCDLLILYGDHALEAQVLSRELPRLEQALGCQVGAVGPVCEVQPVELARAGITALGLPGQELVIKVRNLLSGRLDPR